MIPQQQKNAKPNVSWSVMDLFALVPWDIGFV